MFRKGSLVLLAGLTLCVVTSAAWAQDGNDAKNFGPLSRSGYDARALGMGGAFVALANDAAAGYWNPAGLYNMSEGMTSLTSMYTTGLSNDRFQNYVAVAHRWANMALGATWLNSGIRDIPVTGIGGESLGSTGLFDNIVAGHIGLGNDRAAFGMTIKGYIQSLNSQNRNGVGFDAGVQFKVNDMLTLGGAVTDMGGKVGGDRLPANFRLGAGIHASENLIVGLDVEKAENANTLFHAGAEYGVRCGNDAMWMLRGGVNDAKLNAGVGVRVSKIQADYAFTAERNEALGNAHRVSLGFKF